MFFYIYEREIEFVNRADYGPWPNSRVESLLQGVQRGGQSLGPALEPLEAALGVLRQQAQLALHTLQQLGQTLRCPAKTKPVS